MVSMVMRIAGVALALMIAQGVAAAATIALFGSASVPAGVAGSMPWQVGSAAVTAACLGWLARRSAWRRWRLAAGLAALAFVIQSFNSLVEALFFGFFPPRQFFALLFLTAVTMLLLSPALLLLGSRQPAARPPSWQEQFTAGRLAIGAVAYLVVYFAAGLLVVPYVHRFYEQLSPPSAAAVIAMQLLVRGPIFVAAAAVLIRMSGTTRAETILLSGVAFSVLGGVAPLIVPTSLFPDPVRWAHFVEVVSSNFVYGALLGWLLTAPRRSAPNPSTSFPAWVS